METRKIQQVGGGTYTVSLPKEWATAADIEPGAVVALHSHIDGTLVVQTGIEERNGEPLSLSVADTEPASLEPMLRAAYAAGIDSLELDAPDGVTDETHRRVDRLTRALTGVTVTDSSDDAIQVRSLLDVEEVSITQSVRQLQFAALSAHREATAALTAASAAPAGGDDGTDRIAAMVDHYFQRGLDSLSVMDSLGLTRPELFDRWVTARELARVADHADRMASVADRLDDPVDPDFAADVDDLADRSRDLVEDAVSVVLDAGDGGTGSAAPDDADVATARRCLDERDDLCAVLDDFDRRLFEADGADYRLTHAVDALRGTTEAAGAVAEVGLQSLLRERCSPGSVDVGQTL
ncbi:AbrB/MazE/SpoVT family DNA-binding domain-containing protein [Haloarcula onubensis]|uniref:AbrB/MazE/SpoVT family DNA-binding domain-containing protein n=1 Tax=Haloarcula onubensis TaxID=2950539 RepID=A0ABU2FP58_9EURY|nr:AbrB/MazE/SpoVT family DNA-binding domain-containing protein [Halomicroarcula sp. S3CR25-11]MDS0282037.1 AbrB/MazE/SpoVT family DNA-binding domain-containing protein [Halomicroarcula sp. S3CR25-11]